jgi:hypothetical protein
MSAFDALLFEAMSARIVVTSIFERISNKPARPHLR